MRAIGPWARREPLPFHTSRALETPGLGGLPRMVVGAHASGSGTGCGRAHARRAARARRAPSATPWTAAPARAMCVALEAASAPALLKTNLFPLVRAKFVTLAEGGLEALGQPTSIVPGKAILSKSGPRHPCRGECVGNGGYGGPFSARHLPRGSRRNWPKTGEGSTRRYRVAVGDTAEDGADGAGTPSWARMSGRCATNTNISATPTISPTATANRCRCSGNVVFTTTATAIMTTRVRAAAPQSTPPSFPAPAMRTMAPTGTSQIGASRGSRDPDAWPLEVTGCAGGVGLVLAACLGVASFLPSGVDVAAPVFDSVSASAAAVGAAAIWPS